MLYGHYHKFDLNYYREVYCLQTATCCDQSVFMRKNKIQAHVGGCVVELTQDQRDGAITIFTTTFMPFYDRGYYGRNFGADGKQRIVYPTPVEIASINRSNRSKRRT